MEELQALLANYGLWIVALAVLLDQAGIPIPAPPTLIFAGGLIGAGDLDASTTWLVASLASLPADAVWFETGRRRGRSVLRLLCRISLEPDSCVRSTSDSFARNGPATLLFSKFVPGLQTIAPPLAGASGMTRTRFFAFDLPGAMIWSGVFLGAGAFFHDEIAGFLDAVSEFGGRLVILAVVSLAIWIAYKAWNRHRFLRALNIARIDPLGLHRLYEAEPAPTVIDLRHPDQITEDGALLPGAMAISLDELEARHPEIPRDRDVILYCT